MYKDTFLSNSKGIDYENEKIITHSNSATNKINEWEKSRPNPWIAGIVPLVIAAIIFFVQITAEDYHLRKSLSSPGMQFLQIICFVLAAFLFYCGQKAQTQTKQVVSEARRKAAKETVIVSNFRIYGSTESKDFSIPLTDIIKVVVERVENQNTKISNELLNIVTKAETLSFEFFENNAEITSVCNSLISTLSNEPNVSNPSEINETYTIRITEYYSMTLAIASICQLTGMDYVSAKHFLDNLPCVLAENISKTKSEEFSQILEKNKVTFEIF